MTDCDDEVEDQTGAAAKAPLCSGFERFVTDVRAHYASNCGSETIEAQRTAYTTFSHRFRQPRPESVAVMDDVLAAGLADVPIRIYRPTLQKLGRPAPCILYLHGGGWVLGSVDTHDCITAEIAESTGAVVVSIDYRLAPEHPFPAGLNDCLAAHAIIVRDAGALGVDDGRILVAGDSAGANLAAAMTLALRDRGGPRFIGQALIYPVLGAPWNLPSHGENAEAPMLRTDEMKIFWGLYVGSSATGSDPYAAPILARDLSGLPTALVWTAGHDPARDEGAYYAERLRQAGVHTLYRCAPDLAHGYLRARRMSVSAEGEFEALCIALRNLLAGSIHS